MRFDLGEIQRLRALRNGNAEFNGLFANQFPKAKALGIALKKQHLTRRDWEFHPPPTIPFSRATTQAALPLAVSVR
ncbi:MAG: hypothetical protein ACI9VS_002125 [Candidatus Binatia bacterium]|jgi:hypothetical protein